MFHHKHLNKAQWFGLALDEECTLHARADVYKILDDAISRSWEMDVRREDLLYKALDYLHTDLGVAMGYIRAFKEALNIQEADMRIYQLKACLHNIKKHDI